MGAGGLPIDLSQLAGLAGGLGGLGDLGGLGGLLGGAGGGAGAPTPSLADVPPSTDAPAAAGAPADAAPPAAAAAPPAPPASGGPSSLTNIAGIIGTLSQVGAIDNNLLARIVGGLSGGSPAGLGGNPAAAGLPTDAAGTAPAAGLGGLGNFGNLLGGARAPKPAPTPARTPAAGGTPATPSAPASWNPFAPRPTATPAAPSPPATPAATPGAPAPPPPAGTPVELTLHNAARFRHRDTPAMTWDASIAESAQKWASGCRFAHSGKSGVGENLCMGQSDWNACISAWYNELANYNYANGGFSSATGHATQMVWKASVRLGCGKASCSGTFGGQTMYVCQYAPQGNVMGQFQQNVLPLK
jgi:uncharacterized protein YkwD